MFIFVIDEALLLQHFDVFNVYVGVDDQMPQVKVPWLMILLKMKSLENLVYWCLFQSNYYG